MQSQFVRLLLTVTLLLLLLLLLGVCACGLRVQELRLEIEILRKMRHDNIITMYDVYETMTELFIVQEICVGGELFVRATPTHPARRANMRLRWGSVCAVRPCTALFGLTFALLCMAPPTVRLAPPPFSPTTGPHQGAAGRFLQREGRAAGAAPDLHGTRLPPLAQDCALRSQARQLNSAATAAAAAVADSAAVTVQAGRQAVHACM